MVVLVGIATVFAIIGGLYGAARVVMGWRRRPKVIPRFDRARCVAAEPIRANVGGGWMAEVVRLAVENPRRTSDAAENVRVVLIRTARCADDGETHVAQPNIPFGVTHSQTVEQEQAQTIPGGAHGLVDLYWFNCGGGPGVENHATLQVRPVPNRRDWQTLALGERRRLDLRIDSTNARTRFCTVYVTAALIDLGGGVEFRGNWLVRMVSAARTAGSRSPMP